MGADVDTATTHVGVHPRHLALLCNSSMLEKEKAKLCTSHYELFSPIVAQVYTAVPVIASLAKKS